MKLLIIVVVCAALGVSVDASQEVMTKMTARFGKAMEECQNENKLPESVQRELMTFWNEDSVLSRDTGCALLCLSSKLNLHDETGKLNHENAMEFAKTHGADEATAQTMIDLVHSCEGSAPADPDNCIVVLEIAKCFRSGIIKLNWAPDMELLAEV